MKQQCDGAGETLKNDKLRVAWHGAGNTRARLTNTAKRATSMLMHHGHVPVPVCTIFILWNFHTIPYHPSETTSGNNSVPVPVRPQEHGWGNTRARRTNTANRAPNMLMCHRHVPVHVCTISILWNFHTNPYQSSKNYELKQQGDGAGETSRTTNYELQGTG